MAGSESSEHVVPENYSPSALRGIFFYKKENFQAEVTVSDQEIIIVSSSKKYELSLNYIIGVSHQIHKNPEDTFTSLHFYHYPISDGKRYKDFAVLEVNNSNVRRENEDFAEGFQNFVRTKIQSISNLHFLILLNPRSGTGESLKIYKKFKVLMLQANIRHTIVKTEYSGHAAEIVEKQDLSSYSAIISISGDGLCHEIVNGMMKNNVMKPLGVIPAGTGNGLVVSAAAQDGVLDKTNYAMFKILRFQPRKMDLLLFEAEGIKRYCMLSVMVGLIADIDINSEKLRLFGPFRFDVYTIISLIKKNKYELELELYDSVGEIVSSYKDNYWGLCFGLAPYIDRKTKMFPNCVNNAGMHLLGIRCGLTRVELFKNWSKIERGEHVEPIHDSIFHEKIHKAQVKSARELQLSVDGEALTVSGFTLTDLPMHIASLI